MNSTFSEKSLKNMTTELFLKQFYQWLTNSPSLPPPQGPSSHLQQPRGPADASRLLSVSEAKVGSVDIEDTSLTDGEDDGCWEPLITAAPVLWETTQQISYCAADLQCQHTSSPGLRGAGPYWT